MKSEMMNIRFAVTALLFLGLVPRNVFAQESGFKYDYVSDFSEGLALVGRNGKCWFIDKDGKAVFNMKYENAHSFHEGMAAVKLNGKWGFIDKNGNATAQSGIRTYGSKPKAGQTIHGVVRDSEGPY